MTPGYVNGVRVIWPEPRQSVRRCARGHVGDFTPGGKCRECSREYNREYRGMHGEEIRARSRAAHAAKRAKERA